MDFETKWNHNERDQLVIAVVTLFNDGNYISRRVDDTSPNTMSEQKNEPTIHLLWARLAVLFQP